MPLQLELIKLSPSAFIDMSRLTVPYREIRAHHTASTVTVYQAYNLRSAPPQLSTNV
jgi:hypothetical protein